MLDSTVVIDALRGRPAGTRLRALLDAGEIPYICAVVVQEVHCGLRPGDLGPATALMNAMLMAPLGRIEGALAGEWWRRHAERGVTLGRADCLIAAAALGVGATVATGNPKDFPMEELDVVHWPVGA